MQLDTDIRYIKGIGEARARSMGKLGIHDLAGLVSYFPRAYEDRTRICPIDQLTDGESVCVRAMVAGGFTTFRFTLLPLIICTPILLLFF